MESRTIASIIPLYVRKTLHKPEKQFARGLQDRRSGPARQIQAFPIACAPGSVEESWARDTAS